MAGMNVARQSRRKANTTSTTSSSEISSVTCTSWTDARMVVVRSMTTPRSMPAGISACSSGISARTRSTVWMMLAPGWREMIISTAGLPSARPVVRTSSTPSLTTATSPTRTAAPAR